MLIDFHTHIFPNYIAPHAIDSLKAGVKRCEGTDAKNYTDATYSGLLRSMEENDVTKSVVLPIVTNPQKPDSINNFARVIRNDKVISLASVHPMQDNVFWALEKIKEEGFLGIKMHPEFQQCFIDSEKSIRILQECESLGLMVVLHAGEDIGIEPPVHCTPKRLYNALQYVDGNNIVAAHMGGWRMWDEVEKYLVGTPIYLDTAFVCDYIDREQFLRIVNNHGCDKILFGSDSPWEEPKRTLEFIKSFDFSDDVLDKITYKNALSILNNNGQDRNLSKSTERLLTREEGTAMCRYAKQKGKEFREYMEMRMAREKEEAEKPAQKLSPSTQALLADMDRPYMGKIILQRLIEQYGSMENWEKVLREKQEKAKAKKAAQKKDE